MEATLSIENAKVLVVGLRALAKYGNEVNLITRPDEVILSAMNMSESALGTLTLHRSFFESYDHVHVDGEDECFGAIPIGVLLRPLKIAANGQSDTLEVHLSLQFPASIALKANHPLVVHDEDEPSIEYRFEVALHCKYDVRKVWSIRIHEPERQRSVIDPDPTIPAQIMTLDSPQINSMAARLQHIMTKADGQVELWAYDTELILHAFSSGDISTVLNIESDDLLSYNTDYPETSISFHVQEFAATIRCASALQQHITLRFYGPFNNLWLTITPSHIANDRPLPHPWNFTGILATSEPISPPPPRRPADDPVPAADVGMTDPIEDWGHNTPAHHTSDPLPAASHSSDNGNRQPTANMAATNSPSFTPIVYEAILDADEDDKSLDI